MSGGVIPALFALVLIAILQIIPPRLVGLVIDGISRGTMSRQQLVVWVAVMLGIALLVYGLRYIWRLWLFGASYKLAIQLRQKIYQQLSQQIRFFIYVIVRAILLRVQPMMLIVSFLRRVKVF